MPVTFKLTRATLTLRWDSPDQKNVHAGARLYWGIRSLQLASHPHTSSPYGGQEERRSR